MFNAKFLSIESASSEDAFDDWDDESIRSGDSRDLDCSDGGGDVDGGGAVGVVGDVPNLALLKASCNFKRPNCIGTAVGFSGSVDVDDLLYVAWPFLT